jgi:hypothetical protein
MPATSRTRATALVAGLAIAAALATGGASSAGASEPAAACQEYVVCGQPSGGPSGGGGVPPAPRGGHGSTRAPEASVSSRTDLPLTSYPLTPTIAIPALVLAVGLLGGLAVGLGRRGRDRSGATSAPAR